MKPIPQTIEALEQISRTTGETELLADLQRMADRVQEVVPDCVGLSIAWLDQGVTFTMVASDPELALLDALQYLAGGPCIAAVELGEGLATESTGLSAETQWQVFAQGSAARGVRSTLTFPVNRRGRTTGSINLYGASDHAFESHHDELATILGAWAPGAIRNADLSFSTRQRAEAAPAHLRSQRDIDRAIGVVASVRSLDLDAARAQLRTAAQRAGISVSELARALLGLYD